MKILFLQKRILFPTDTGGKIRTLNILRHLAEWHEVTYLCNVQAEDEPYLEQMRALGLRLEAIPWNETPRGSLRFYWDLAKNLMSPYPYNVNKDYDPQLRARAEQLLAEDDYDLLICDFVQMARNAVGLNVKASVLFQHNVEAEIFRRHAERDRGWLRRQYMAHQWRKMRRFEAEAGHCFNRVIAVSDRDKQHFEQQYGWPDVHAIDTAVDTDYFHPTGEPEDDDLVVFVGSMDWLPNEDGVQYFVNDIWPLVRKQQPNARFQIVGRNPTPAVRRLANMPGVEVLGTVPDVRPFLSKAAVVVVPLRIGGGTRIKIYEAMAMGKVAVSTPLGAEGLPICDGTEILLRDDPTELADAIVKIQQQPDFRRDVGLAACCVVAERFSAEKVARQFDNSLHQVFGLQISLSGSVK